MTNWDRLNDEYRAERIGDSLLSVITSVMAQALRSRPPVPGATLEDMVQGFIADELLGERQLEYAFTVATDERHFIALLALQCRRHIGRQRERSVIDNLLRRSGVLLERGFERVASPRQRRFRIPGSDAPDWAPTEDALYRAAVLAAAWPRQHAHGKERQPALYNDRGLEQMLVGIAKTLGTSFGLSDLRRVFTLALTDIVVTDLVELQDPVLVEQRELSPDRAVVVEDTVRQLLEHLDSGQRRIVAAKACGISDGDIAVMLGRSRPTVAKSKDRALALLNEHLIDLNEAERDAAVSLLTQTLLRDGMPP